MTKEARPNQKRLQFDYDKIEAKKATEPPKPTSYAAQNYVPNTYRYSSITHEKIQEIRDKAKFSDPSKSIDSLNLDHCQSVDKFPESFPHFVRGRDSLRKHISTLFQSKIASYDGAMGTMIQNYSKKNRLEEEEYRGSQFKDWTCNVKGNNDMLSITQPHIISGIYKQYLEAGSDLIGTNTFSSTTIAMADYEMED